MPDICSFKPSFLPSSRLKQLLEKLEPCKHAVPANCWSDLLMISKSGNDTHILDLLAHTLVYPPNHAAAKKVNLLVNMTSVAILDVSYVENLPIGAPPASKWRSLSGSASASRIRDAVTSHARFFVCLRFGVSLHQYGYATCNLSVRVGLPAICCYGTTFCEIGEIIADH